jgi:hypothetical protein
MPLSPAVRRSSLLLLPAAVLVTIGCNVNAALEEVVEARHLSSDLVVQFTKAADLSNLAVMADTDEASVAFAREARQRTAAAQKDAVALRPLLETLRFEEERQLLGAFESRFAEYQKLDGTVLDLAVENTNLKAQRLSFGAAQEAADAFARALEPFGQVGDTKEGWRLRAIAADARARAREIQALEAPHIAATEDSAMTGIEARMSAAAEAARRDLATLAASGQPGAQARLDAATAELDRLLRVNQEVIGLSRRNTNVRSLALALTEKRATVAACEESLHALQTALATRGYARTR